METTTTTTTTTPTAVAEIRDADMVGMGESDISVERKGIPSGVTAPTSNGEEGSPSEEESSEEEDSYR